MTLLEMVVAISVMGFVMAMIATLYAYFAVQRDLSDVDRYSRMASSCAELVRGGHIKGVVREQGCAAPDASCSVIPGGEMGEVFDDPDLGRLAEHFCANDANTQMACCRTSLDGASVLRFEVSNPDQDYKPVHVGLPR
ncbi:type II secretion system GspH family protein [Halorhodospira sp. 9621]|nr:type II secretion system GspH family protein [Halorhodospira sp. 9621]